MTPADLVSEIGTQTAPPRYSDAFPTAPVSRLAVRLSCIVDEQRSLIIPERHSSWRPKCFESVQGDVAPGWEASGGQA
jgi:hypothetical protein